MVDVHAADTACDACAPSRGSRRSACRSLGAVVRPQRPELVGGVEHAPQILQPPLAAVDRPQRVALEVEEQVALVGRRAAPSAAARRRPRRAACRRRAAATCRRACAVSASTVRADSSGTGPSCAARPLHRGDARVDQAGALADPHARDEQQVVVRAHLDRRTPGSGSRRGRPRPAHDTGVPPARWSSSSRCKGGAAGQVDR